MKLIKQIFLWFREGNSDKVYEVDLCETGTDQYVVNFRYGKRGSALKEGTKTTQAVNRTEADKVYDKLVTSKQKEGYKEVEKDNPDAFNAKTTAEKISTSSREEAIVKHLERAVKSGKSGNWKIERIIWRAGELRVQQAVPVLMEIEPKVSELGKYCIAWALGRIGDATAKPLLARMRQTENYLPSIQRIATEAWLAVAETEEKEPFFNILLNELPAVLKTEITQASADNLHKQLSTLLKVNPMNSSLLEKLYLLSLRHHFVKQVIMEHLKMLPVQARYFNTIRHIFKMAEFRSDGQVFGLIAYRLQESPSGFYSPRWGNKVWIDGRYVVAKEELSKPNAQIAYSDQTKAYFKRRSWRTLLRMGKAGDENYVNMAVGVLLAYSDAKDKVQPRQAVFRYYDYKQRKYFSRVSQYEDYAPYLAFNHILYGNSPRYDVKKNGRAWYLRPDYVATPELPREEAFPELWNKRPQGLLHLLAESRVERVHEFAVRALRDQPEMLKRLDMKFIMLLLEKPYGVTVKFAIEQIRDKFDYQQPDIALIELLLNSEIAEARDLARQWIQGTAALLSSNINFIAKITVSRFADVRTFAHAFLKKLSLTEPQVEMLIVRLFSQVFALRAEAADSAAIARDLSAVLFEIYGEKLKTIGLDVIRDLLSHPLPQIQELAGRLLINHNTKANELPDDVFAALLQASEPGVRRLGVELFGKLPHDILLERKNVLINFAISTQPEVRQTVRPIIGALADMNTAFSDAVTERLVPVLLRRQQDDGLYADVLSLLLNELEKSLAVIDNAVAWTLLHGKREEARQLGSVLLQKNIRAEQLSMRQIVQLANHEFLQVRQVAWQMFRDHVGRIKQEVNEALRLLDAKWDDSRNFGFAFFREHFTATDWNPTLLVGIADNVRDDVQTFGRELISRFFEEQNGTEYLLKLSQHPSANLQLFATNYLERFAAGQPERQAALELYFVTVLAHVNRSRVAKDRIMHFLRTEAMKHEASAQLAARIFAHQSATMAIEDKAACIEIMREIHGKYAHIELPVSIVPVQAKV